MADKKEANAEAERQERLAELGRQQAAAGGTAAYEEVEGVPPSAEAVAQQEALEESLEETQPANE